MPNDWKLKDELDEVLFPHSDFYFCYGSQKRNFYGKSKIPTGLISSLPMLTIPMALKKMLLLTNFCISYVLVEAVEIWFHHIGKPIQKTLVNAKGVE